LDEKKLNYFKNVLEKERERIKVDLEILEKENKVAIESVDVAGDDGSDEIGDSASITIDREKDFSLENNMRDILNQINRALDNIDEKKYGKCDSCNEPINEARLRALPYADLCISCKTKLEK